MYSLVFQTSAKMDAEDLFQLLLQEIAIATMIAKHLQSTAFLVCAQCILMNKTPLFIFTAMCTCIYLMKFCVNGKIQDYEMMNEVYKAMSSVNNHK